MGGRFWKQRLSGAEAAQIVELAVSLPLLLVFVVGIYDFGQAFNTKEKLNFAARDAARFGSTQPTSDFVPLTPPPPSVVAIRDLVDADLVAEGVNDCGLGSISSTGTLVWTATGTCPNSATFTLTIDRGFVVPGSAQPVQQISTHVDLQYPYQWQYGNVIGLLVPGATSAGITIIDTDSLAANQD